MSIDRQLLQALEGIQEELRELNMNQRHLTIAIEAVVMALKRIEGDLAPKPAVSLVFKLGKPLHK